MIPLFVRGGTLIPSGPVMQHSDERPLDELTILVYPPAPDGRAEAELYEDDGVTHRYRQGERCVTPLRCVSERERVRLDIGAAAGTYQGQPARRTVQLRIWLPHDPTAVLLAKGDGPAAPLERRDGPGPRTDALWWREGPFMWVRVPVVAPPEPVAVMLELQ